MDKLFKRVMLNTIGLIILAVSILLPTPSGLTPEGKIMLGILLFAGFMWLAKPIPIAATGLMVMILPPIFGVVKSREAFSYFGNRAVFFLIGAFVLTAAIEKHNIHKRISLFVLSRVGEKPVFFTLGIFILSAFSSFIMPEHAVAALMVPVVLSILAVAKVIPKKSNFGKICMLSVAFGCSIGSLGTLVGGARNPITLTFLEETGNISLSFFDWMYYSMPVVFLSIPVIWLVLIRMFPPEMKSLKKVNLLMQKEVNALGSPKPQEVITISILVLTILGWVFLHYQLGIAVIAILGGLLLFMAGVIKWDDVEKRVPWGIILLYGGAITLGVNLSRTGAAQWLATRAVEHTGNHPYLILLTLIALTVFLTGFMSNTAAVAMLLPIGLGIASQVEGITVIVTSMTIALAGGLAFMLVIATPGNAITYSTGYYSTRDLFKSGSLITILCICILFFIALTYWKLIGLW